MAYFLPQAQCEALRANSSSKTHRSLSAAISDSRGSRWILSCFSTLIDCCCTYLYLMHQMAAFTKNHQRRSQLQPDRRGPELRSGPQVSPGARPHQHLEVESIDQLLISVQSPWAMEPGGPPTGYNIVMNLAAPPPCWPPSQGAQKTPVIHDHVLSIHWTPNLKRSNLNYKWD